MISQADLIDEFSPDTLGWARFDKDKRFRCRLGRKLTPRSIDVPWDEIIAYGGIGLIRVVFLMLNPSTADAFKLDMTVARCCEFARRWGADIVEVVNLFAFRATDPRELARAVFAGMSPIESVGGDVTNNMEILAACKGATRVMAAWGNGGTLYDRDQRVRELLADHGIRLEVLRLSKDGHPNHPLARGKKLHPVRHPPPGVDPMRISIQRQCDGTHPDLGDPKEICDARIEINLELPDRAPAPAWDAAFAAAAVALGWRRIGGKGRDAIALPVDLVDQHIVPQADTWIVCPEHGKGCVCARCGSEPCSCMGGPRFDVRPE